MIEIGLTLYEFLTLEPAFHEKDRDRLIKRAAPADARHAARSRLTVGIEQTVGEGVDRRVLPEVHGRDRAA